MTIEEHVDIEALRRETDGYMKTVGAESDRGTALVTAAFLDETLKRLLMTRISAGGNKKNNSFNRYLKPLARCPLFQPRLESVMPLA